MWYGPGRGNHANDYDENGARMTDLSLHALDTGWVDTERHFMNLNVGVGEPYAVPIPFFVITHPKGTVVFDSGFGPDVARDAAAVLGGFHRWFKPRLGMTELATEQMRAAGLDPDSVRWVIQSHLHIDHTGGLGQFPAARHLVQRRELAYAYAPDWFQGSAYWRPDFDRDLRWSLLDGFHDDLCDLYGDGTIRTVFTPGHSPGHMSLLVELPESGPILLVSDAAYNRDQFEERALPPILHSAGDVAASVQRLRRLAERTGARVIFGHEPEDWADLRAGSPYR